MQDESQKPPPRTPSIEKVPTGIPGLDEVTRGGIPKGRTTLLAGTTGSGKTILSIQFLAAVAEAEGGGGVFVTFEERAEDIRRNMIGFGWDIRRWEEEGRFAFVDASPQPEEETVEVGDFDLDALLARIEHAVRKVGASRVSIDSLGSVLCRFKQPITFRREILRIAAGLRRIEVTALITAERSEEYGPVALYGVEEYVTDNVLILRNVLEEEKRRRTIEVLKLRGTDHQKGEFLYSIEAREGVVVLPLTATVTEQRPTTLRLTSGNGDLDAMCHGGFFRDSVILVSGSTGTGKTLAVAEFVGGGAGQGERCLLFAFEESRAQLFRNASGWGCDLEGFEKRGLLRVVSEYPESKGMEDHFISMQAEINDFRPSRVAVDSLSALERVSTLKGFREFFIGITSFIKAQQILGVFTSNTPAQFSGLAVADAHISTITDAILLLRYVEVLGEIRRGITVLKMRGSQHDKGIREFTIDGDGMKIGRPFRNLTGIISSNPRQIMPGEIERLNELFPDESEG